MRTLTAELEAAQRAATRKPYLQAVISDRFAGIRRFRPTLWYSGAENPGPHAAAVPTDGSLNRLRIAANTLYVQRVTAPTSGSTYSSWTLFRTFTRLCAIAQYGANLVAFAVDHVTPTTIYTATSADNGATWSGWTLAITHAVTITCIAAAAKSNGNMVCIVNNGNNISAYKYTGAWSAAVTSTDGAITPDGIAVSHSGDFNVVVTGVTPATTASNLATRVYGDGFLQTLNTWSSAYKTILASANGSGVSYGQPFTARPETRRTTFREQYTGTGAYDRSGHTYMGATQDFGLTAWREPAPLNIVAAYGLAITFDAATAFITSANLVYGWSLTPASVDVSGDLLAASYDERAFSTKPATFELDNSKGAYLPLPAAITQGAQVEISPGYYVAGSPVVSADILYHVTAIEHDPDRGRVIITAAPIWQALADWTAVRAIQYAAGSKNLFGIAQDIVARAGLEFAANGASAQVTSLTPAFTIPAGADGLTALRSLLARVPDVVRATNEFLSINEPLAADTADAAYEWKASGTNHPIHAARYVERAKPSPHVRVLGGAIANVIGESIDYDESALTYSGPRIIADRELTTGTLAANRAASEARDLEIDSRADRITAPVHCGLEVNDVLAITDSRQALTASKRRVLAIATKKDNRGHYEQVITLGEA